MVTGRQIIKSGGRGGGVTAKTALGVQDKVLWLPNNRFLFFIDFTFGFFFSDFCSVCDFEFFNSIFTKKLEIDSSFLQFLF
jgi:hypothetical protein